MNIPVSDAVKSASTIDYFENGCLCFLSGKIEKGNTEEYYLAHCTCTRHPNSANRDCWDKDEKVRNEAIAVIKTRHPHLFN